MVNVTVAEQDGLKRKLTVEVPLSEVESTYNEVYGRLRSNIRVPGFRPGKYPRALAEKRFKELMAGEAMQTLVPKYFDQALSELELRPATEPKFENLDIDKNKPFSFDVAFEVVPEFELQGPEAYALEPKTPKVAAKDVDARIEELRKARAGLKDKGKKVAADGDVVTFDFRGTRDGEPFEGGTAEGQQAEVGAGQYLPEFDAQLTGIKAGESKTFDLTFPEDYGGPELAGQTVQFELTATQVQEKEPAELNKEFFAQFGELETLDDFKAHLKEQLAEEQQREIQQAYQEALTEQIKALYDFAVPESLVEQSLHEFEHQLEHEDPDGLLQDEKKLAKRKDEERAKIVENLRVAYVLDRQAKAYEVTADEEQVRQQFFMQAYMMRQNPAEMAQSPFGRRMLMQIENNIITGQTLEKLAEAVLAAGGGKGKAAGGAKAKAGAKGAATADSKAAPKRQAAAGKAGSGEAAAAKKAPATKGSKAKATATGSAAKGKTGTAGAKRKDG